MIKRKNPSKIIYIFNLLRKMESNLIKIIKIFIIILIMITTIGI